jgi:hypothetical protein
MMSTPAMRNAATRAIDANGLGICPVMITPTITDPGAYLRKCVAIVGLGGSNSERWAQAEVEKTVATAIAKRSPHRSERAR